MTNAAHYRCCSEGSGGHGPGIPDGQFHNYNKSYHDHGQETADTVLLNRFEFPPN